MLEERRAARGKDAAGPPHLPAYLSQLTLAMWVPQQLNLYRDDELRILRGEQEVDEANLRMVDDYEGQEDDEEDDLSVASEDQGRARPAQQSKAGSSAKGRPGSNTGMGARGSYAGGGGGGGRAPQVGGFPRGEGGVQA